MLLNGRNYIVFQFYNFYNIYNTLVRVFTIFNWVAFGLYFQSFLLLQFIVNNFLFIRFVIDGPNRFVLMKKGPVIVNGAVGRQF